MANVKITDLTQVVVSPNGVIPATDVVPIINAGITKKATVDQLVSKSLSAGGIAVDANINGVTIGMGLASINSNTALGKTALSANTTGVNNTGVGSQSLRFNTTGGSNTGCGLGTLAANTTGAVNTAVGTAALQQHISGDNNTGIGAFALYSDKQGSGNTAVGASTLNLNTSTVATFGTITGGSGYTTGSYTNVLLTYVSGSNASTYPAVNITVTAGVVTAVTLAVAANGSSGGNGFLNNTTVMSCASIGAGTGFLISPATLAHGVNNTAVGASALYTNTTGYNNTASGVGALLYNTTGYNNTASGLNALQNNTTGYYNTASGVRALPNNTTGNYNTASGVGALQNNTTGNSNTASGTSALYSNTTGYNNTASGVGALLYNTTGYNNTASGLNALQNNTTGSYNTASGFNVLYSNTTGNYNTASGFNALYFNTTGSNNSASGQGALPNNTTGNYNTASGVGALLNNTTGSNNLASGMSALYNNTTGSGNSAFNPLNSAGTYAPVFNPITENNRFCMGSTGVTNAYIQVAWTVVSDARDKTNFAPVPHGLDFVTKLQPTAYQFKEDRETDIPTGIVRYGFKAQDILALEGDTPVIIDTEDLDKLRFNSDSLIPVLVNAIKELTDRLQILEEK